MITVDRADLAELDTLATLFDAYRRFYGQPAELHGARTFLGNRLENHESVIFLARLDGTPAGLTQLYPIFSSVRMRRAWLLNDLYVAESARKHGVGHALLDAARRHGEATGAHELVLQTTRDNAPAQALYAKSGWRRQDDFYWYDLGLD